MQYFALNNKRVAPDIYTFIIFLFRDFFFIQKCRSAQGLLWWHIEIFESKRHFAFFNLHCLGLKDLKGQSLC